MRRVLALFVVVSLLLPLPARADLRAAPVWYDQNPVGTAPDWHYRVPITVPAASVNSTIKVDVNFNTLLTAMGVSGTFDLNSPRVVRPTGALAATQEFTDAVFAGTTDSVGDGKGEVRFILEDAGPSTYYLYFDITQNGAKPVNPQTPINGNFEQSAVAGTQNPPRWTATKTNAAFDAQVRPSENPSITTDGTLGGIALPTQVTNGTPNTGGFSYLIGSRTNNEAANGAPAVTLSRTVVVPATATGNLVVRYRVEGWDGSADTAAQWDFLSVAVVGVATTEIVGPTAGNYITFPFSPNLGLTEATATASGYGQYNGWDTDTAGVHYSGMTIASGAEPWFTRTFDLTSFAGQTVTLRFTSSHTTLYRTWFHIDDVEWSVVAGTLGTPQAFGVNIIAPNDTAAGAASVYVAGNILAIRARVDAAPATGQVTADVINQSGTVVATGVRLFNDGTHGDATANDNIWTNDGSVVADPTYTFLAKDPPGTGWLLRVFARDSSTSTIGASNGLVRIPAQPNTPAVQANFYNIDEQVFTFRAPPVVIKSFAPSSIGVGDTSVLTITLQNTNATPITGASFTDTYPTGLVNTGSAGGSTTCTGGTVTATNGGSSVALSAGTIPANGSCTVTVNVTSASAGSYVNSTGTVATTNAGSGASASATLTVILYPTVTGIVYSDANHNSYKEGGETGTGLTLYAKLVPAASPSGPAQQVVPVDPLTGAYQLNGVSPGTYIVVIDNNNTPADVTPTIPASWTGTEVPNQVRTNVVVGSNPVPNINFGLFNGNTLIGQVFNDNGSGAGTANDGVKNGTEAGLSAAVVKLTDNAGATTYDSTSTDASGNYLLWVPASLTGSSLKVTEINPAGYLSTGGSAGNTAGVYSRATNTTSFSYTAGASYTGVNFGLVPPNSLSPNGAQTAQPGTVVFYAHTFQAGSGGQVTFSLANTPSPSSPAWNQVLYQDSNCSATLEAAEPQVTAAIAVTAGQKICLIVKQFVPAGTALGAQNSTTLSAAFSYTNASPVLAATLTATDVTTVGQPGALALSKLVNNVTQGGAAATAVSATPGDTLQYTLTAVNNGSQALSTLAISDATPAFTTHLSASCPGSLPAGITACAVSTQPAAGGQGGLQWTFVGTLPSGAQLVVSYQVKVNQ